MAEKKKKLNKGLDAIFGGDITSLIDDIEHNTPESSQEKIKLDEIRPNPYQPRKVFDEQALNELALSIQEHGIFQPVILKKSVQGYEIVAGERRCRAAKIAELDEVPAIIVDFTDQQMMEIALLENIQREDLNAIEEAQAYHTMMEKLHLTQNELANRIGKSRTHITNTLRLLNLPEKIQEYVLDGSLSMGHARALITLDKEKALRIAKRVIDEKLSVRDVENIVKGFELQEARKNKPKVEKPKEYQYVEGLLRKKYRTRIKVDDKSITINEVHLIDLIGRNQPVNLVKLSELLEVSRSAITQSVRRLTKKDLVSFEFAPDNEKNKYLILSKKGVDVFNIHKEQQEHIETAIFSVLKNYSDEDLQMVMKLMDDVEKVWQELPW